MIVNDKTALVLMLAGLRKDLRSQKKQLIAANLSLATKFWPVYDQCQGSTRTLHEEERAYVSAINIVASVGGRD
jgi:hypothetical protein